MDSCMRTSTCRRAWATSSVTTLLTRIHIRDGGSPREIYFLPFQNFHLPSLFLTPDGLNPKSTVGYSPVIKKIPREHPLEFDSLSSIFILHSKLEFFQWISQPWWLANGFRGSEKHKTSRSVLLPTGCPVRFRGSVDSTGGFHQVGPSSKIPPSRTTRAPIVAWRRGSPDAMLKKATGFLAQIPGGDWNHGLFDDFF